MIPVLMIPLIWSYTACKGICSYLQKLGAAPCKKQSSGICRQRRPRLDYACAVWSRPLLSAYRIIGYYRMNEWRVKAWTKPCACARWSESAYFAHVWRRFFAWRGSYEDPPGKVTVTEHSPHSTQGFNCFTLEFVKWSSLCLNLVLTTNANMKWPRKRHVVAKQRLSDASTEDRRGTVLEVLDKIMNLAPDKVFFAAKSIDIFLFLDKSVCSVTH